MRLPGLRALLVLGIGVLVAVGTTHLTMDQQTNADSSVSDGAQITRIAEGLRGPVGMAELPDGRLAVAEGGTGQGDDSAGMVVVDPRGGVDRVVAGLPSRLDSGDLAGANLVAVAPDGATLYLGNNAQGHLWTVPLSGGAPVVGSQPLGPDDLGRALEPLNNVRVINPFAATFDDAGRPVVTDATGNGIAIETGDGATEFIHRFAPLTNPEIPSTTVDPVPTGIARSGDEYLVTLFGGCPYPDGSGELVAVDADRQQRTLVDGLTMPIDVEVGPDGRIWVLEFARYDHTTDCFDPFGYRPDTGRLSVLDDGELQLVTDELSHPGSLVIAADGNLYVTDVYAGEVLRVEVDEGRGVAGAQATSPDEEQEPWFRDVAAERGIDMIHGAFHDDLSMDPVAAMGGGLCWIDVEADGWLDLYVVNSHALDEARAWERRGGLPTNRLYRNDRGSFADISESSGTDLAIRGNGCVAADLNLDGSPDLIVSADGDNHLLMNQGDGTFVDVTVAAGLNDAPEWHTAIAVSDVTGNGWPDVFVGAYLDLEVFVDEPLGTFPQDHPGLVNRLYLNEGPDPATGIPSFRDAAAEAGLIDAERTLGAVFSDLTGRGHPDLLVANDGEPNRFYRHEWVEGGQDADPTGLGFRYVDVTDDADVGDPFSGMGVASGDFSGNGRADLLITNWDRELNSLYLNDREPNRVGAFRYATFSVGLAGLGRGQTGWGVTWTDLTNDGHLDLFLVNGRVPMQDLDDDAETPRFYANRAAQQRPGQLLDLTQRSGLARIGALNARGSAVADVDNDGRMDVAIASIAGPVTLLRNEAADGHWLRVRFAEFSPGVTVTATLPDGRELVRELLVGSSYLASEDPRLHLGLGDVEVVPHIEVRWSDGTTAELTDVAVDREVVVERP